ncbi:MAG TPA: BolA family protein [Rhizomicrobium sp.]|nr:BolA family protein [Rhizomicrobium sp.]
MSVAERIRDKLTAAFAPVELSIEDESARHAGHAGARPGGETHFRVRIVSEEFRHMNRVERQRRVHAVLADEMKDRVHALALTAKAPGEHPHSP